MSRERVALVLRAASAAITAQELARRCGLPYPTVRTHLRAMRNRGLATADFQEGLNYWRAVGFGKVYATEAGARKASRATPARSHGCSEPTYTRGVRPGAGAGAALDA